MFHRVLRHLKLIYNNVKMPKHNRNGKIKLSTKSELLGKYEHFWAFQYLNY